MNKKIIINNKCHFNYDDMIFYKDKIEGLNNDNIVYFPNILYLSLLKDFKAKVGAQNFYTYANGDYIGELTLESLRSINVNYTMLAPLERKEYNNESNEEIRRKINISISNSFNTILFVGEEKMLKDPFGYIEKLLNSYLKNVKKDNIKYLSICYNPSWHTGYDDVDINILRKTIIDIKEYFIKNYSFNIDVYFGEYVNKDNVNNILEFCDGIYIGKSSIDFDNVKEIIDFINR